jgi:antibiotic biosynthesis monooxygenase
LSIICLNYDLARAGNPAQFFRPQPGESNMTAFNIVRFKVQPGQQDYFIEAHRKARPNFKGFRGGVLVKTGEQTFCIIGEWASFKAMAAARPQMIGLLDTFRASLEDLGNGLGVTDPVSGDVVLRLAASKPAKKKKKGGKKKKSAKRKKRM